MALGLWYAGMDRADEMSGLRDTWRMMWGLGGPAAIFLFWLDGSLERRIREKRLQTKP